MRSAVDEFNLAEPDPRMAALLAEYPAELFDDRLYRSIALAERYCRDAVVGILLRLGVTADGVDGRASAEVCADLNLAEAFAPRLEWLLGYLVAAGLLGRSGGRFTARDPWPEPEPDRLREAMTAVEPRNAPTLDLLDAAAAAYPVLAAGATPAGATALLGPESVPLWLAYFDDDHPLYAVNNHVAAIAAARRLRDRAGPLRILEIGAGAGSATLALLRALGAAGLTERIERVLVTEPSAFFRRRATKALAVRHPGVPLGTAALDMGAPWAEQGAGPSGFDLVFAVNVLHVARDLSLTLREARAALAPGGLLVAGECLRPRPQHPIYVELAFGLLDSFTDVVTDPVLRPRPGFLTPEEWAGSFAGAGFAGFEVTPDHVAIRNIYPSLFVGALCARAPGGSAGE